MNNHTSNETDHLVLGQNGGEIPLLSLSEHQEMATHIAQQAQRLLHIFTYDLDRAIFGRPAFIEAVKQLIIGHRNASVRILLQDFTRVQQEGHQLIDLGQRLSSRIEIRRPGPEHIDHHENFLTADRTGFIQRNFHDRYDGTADFHAPLKTSNLDSFFTDAWQHSEPYGELRRLHL
jgi:hypothetical protein